MPGINSYIENFWEDAYLTQRSSIAINTNPFFVLEDDPTPSRTSQIARATTLVWSSLKFCQGVRAGELEPDMFRTTPLCMRQYLRLFGTCRIPRAARDDVRTCAEARHIVVMCRGHIYWFNVLDGSGRLCISESILRETLRSIREDSIAFTPEQNISNAVGILTSTDRETWARCRETISSMSEHNEKSLRIVDESLFVLCLDDNSPQSPADMAKCALHGTSVVESFMGSSGMQVGTSINRWYDKSLQLVVCQNGAAAINFEHSVIDGYTVLRFASDVFTETILRFAENIRGGFAHRSSAGMRSAEHARAEKEEEAAKTASFHRIEWVLDRELLTSILKAEAFLSDRIMQVDLQVLEFANYGKNFIVDQRMSPDAYVQIAMQVAYYQLYKETACTYETLMTKKFFHGRTEAGFVVTEESTRLAESFDRNSLEVSKELLKKALDAHVKVVKLGSEGRGIRHLYALKCLSERGRAAWWSPRLLGATSTVTLPDLFKGVAWKKLNRHVISSSNCGNPALRLFGFGPVCEDGFGFGYIIKDDNMQFCVSSFNRQTSRLIAALEDTLLNFKRSLQGQTTLMPLSPAYGSMITQKHVIPFSEAKN
uniref:Choline/carnitine acyltransferase domain-containing protein n=1 Tax=Guillardia theta TaxID=55529 RepID=A0A6U6E7K1_GUITH